MGQSRGPLHGVMVVACSTAQAGTVPYMLMADLGGQNGPGTEAWKFIAPHGIALDSRGDIYVGEVSYTDRPTTHPDIPIPKGLRSLQKLRKVK